MTCTLPDDTNCSDVAIADTVRAQLRAWARDHRPGGTPFFLGLGIHKPHLPWAVPRRFKQQLPELEAVPLAAHRLPPAGMPDARQKSAEHPRTLNTMHFTAFYK